MPFNFCGMGIDLLRSCYSTKMQVFDPPGEEIDVQWWFCDDKAKLFPDYTRFASGNWASDRHGWTGTGEVEGAPREWADGEPPSPNPITNVGGFSPFGFVATDNSVTMPVSIQIPGDCTILVICYAFLVGGVDGVTAVSDDVGHLFTRDFSAKSSVDSHVSIAVFRGVHAGPRTLAKFTAHFFGQNLKCTMAVQCTTGLKLQEPITVVTKSGSALVQPNLEAFASGHLSSFVLACFACADMSNIFAVPTGFGDLGSAGSDGMYCDGNNSCQISDYRHFKIKPKWSVAISGAWIAAGLVYQGVPKERLPGQKFCGPKDLLQLGAPADAVPVCTDTSGYSACCYDFMAHVTCCDWEKACFGVQHLTAIILDARDTEPDSLVNYGAPIQLFGNVSYLGYYWALSTDPGPRYMALSCALVDGVEKIVLANNIGPTQAQCFATRFRPKPFGVLFEDYPATHFPFKERWTVLIGTMPPEPPPIPGAVFGIFPESYFSKSFFPTKYLG